MLNSTDASGQNGVSKTGQISETMVLKTLEIKQWEIS